MPQEGVIWPSQTCFRCGQSRVHSFHRRDPIPNPHLQARLTTSATVSDGSLLMASVSRHVIDLSPTKHVSVATHPLRSTLASPNAFDLEA